jgi:methylated-DNA-[protein]-cysteine S-methyltransferase
LGSVVLFARDTHLCRLDMYPPDSDDVHRLIAMEFPEATESPGRFRHAGELLRRYFDGEEVLLDIPIDLSGLRDFTKRVLEETRKIPYGKIASYGMIAGRLGYPNAARAVGQALKRNPIPVVIPCHRIVRGDGSLGGFDMGLDTKVRLLSIEGLHVRELQKSMLLS